MKSKHFLPLLLIAVVSISCNQSPKTTRLEVSTFQYFEGFYSLLTLESNAKFPKSLNHYREQFDLCDETYTSYLLRDCTFECDYEEGFIPESADDFLKHGSFSIYNEDNIKILDMTTRYEKYSYIITSCKAYGALYGSYFPDSMCVCEFSGEVKMEAFSPNTYGGQSKIEGEITIFDWVDGVSVVSCTKEFRDGKETITTYYPNGNKKKIVNGRYGKHSLYVANPNSTRTFKENGDEILNWLYGRWRCFSYGYLYLMELNEDGTYFLDKGNHKYISGVYNITDEYVMMKIDGEWIPFELDRKNKKIKIEDLQYHK